MQTQADAAEALSRLGVQYRQEMEALDRTRDLVKAAALEADEAGIPRTEIIRLSGMSRTTAYDMFREIEAARRKRA